jgi:type I restriction enzyme S subunit
MANIPKIRFKGFTGGWKQKSFFDVFSVFPNNTFSRNDLNYEKGTVKNIHYGDILIKLGEYTDVADETLPFVNDEIKPKKLKSAKLKNGDIIIADTAEDETAGKCTEISNSETVQVVAGLHTIPCRPKVHFANAFLGFYMNSSAYHDQLLPLMQGTKVTSISKTSLQDTNIIYPNEFFEQQKIGALFEKIDTLINKNQHKLESLQKFKKAMLQNMFPKAGSSQPKIRFRGFTGAWEQCKLGKLLQTLPFKAFIKTPEQDGKYEIVQQGNKPIIGYANGRPCSDYKDTVIFGDHTLSLYKPNKPFFVATDGVRIVKGKHNIGGLYLLALLEKYKPQSEGCKRYYSILSDCDCSFTADDTEQMLIGSYFRTLDNLITLHQRKVDSLQKLKKAMLQKMFA